MAEIEAFRGIRYDLGHVGSLADVVAPPYDVIDPDLQNALYKRHPANVIRLILNRQEPGDDEASNRYTRAAQFLRNWLREGVLRRDAQAAVYVYHQQFDYDGRRWTRRGFMARVRLEPFGTGNIFPHEETRPAPKADRLKLMDACRANLSPIFGLYPDPDNAAQRLLEQAIQQAAPTEATDHLGVVHRLWPVTDPATVAQLNAAMGPKPIFIADGHHRYETACNYRDQLAKGRPLDAGHPANSVLMMCVSMDDPGMLVLPTHRLFRGLPNLTSSDLTAKLAPCFTAQIVGQGSELAETAWQSIRREGEQGTIGLFAPGDQRWLLARISSSGREKMAQIAAHRSGQWRSLGVAILHHLVIQTLLDARQLPEPKYVHRVDEVRAALQQGDVDGRPFSLAALVMPATLQHIRAAAEQGKRMPSKSTYFYPKLLSGLVINPLQ